MNLRTATTITTLCGLCILVIYAEQSMIFGTRGDLDLSRNVTTVTVWAPAGNVYGGFLMMECLNGSVQYDIKGMKSELVHVPYEDRNILLSRSVINIPGNITGKFVLHNHGLKGSYGIANLDGGISLKSIEFLLPIYCVDLMLPPDIWDHVQSTVFVFPVELDSGLPPWGYSDSPTTPSDVERIGDDTKVRFNVMHPGVYRLVALKLPTPLEVKAWTFRVEKKHVFLGGEIMGIETEGEAFVIDPEDLKPDISRITRFEHFEVEDEVEIFDRLDLPEFDGYTPARRDAPLLINPLELDGSAWPSLEK